MFSWLVARQMLRENKGSKEAIKERDKSHRLLLTGKPPHMLVEWKHPSQR